MEYGETFNKVFPLFGARFRSERKKFVFSQVPEGSPLQLCLDVMMGFMYREKGYIVFGNDRDRYWLRATALITRAENTAQRLYARVDLLATQGVLALAFLFRSSGHHQAFVKYAREGMLMARTAGLHRHGTVLSDGSTLSDQVILERMKLFWHAFALNQDASFFFQGCLPIQLMADCNTPTDFPSNQIFLPSLGTIRFGKLFADFARVKFEVYNLLYTVEAEQEDRDSRIESVLHCERKFHKWAKSMPQSAQPGHASFPAAHTIRTQDRVPLRELFRLHIEYHSCHVGLFRVYQDIRESSPTSVDGLDDFRSRDVESIRYVLQLVDVVPLSGSPFVW